jgi:hypothetical protein
LINTNEDNYAVFNGQIDIGLNENSFKDMFETKPKEVTKTLYSDQILIDKSSTPSIAYFKTPTEQIIPGKSIWELTITGETGTYQALNKKYVGTGTIKKVNARYEIVGKGTFRLQPNSEQQTDEQQTAEQQTTQTTPITQTEPQTTEPQTNQTDEQQTAQTTPITQTEPQTTEPQTNQTDEQQTAQTTEPQTTTDNKTRSSVVSNKKMNLLENAYLGRILKKQDKGKIRYQIQVQPKLKSNELFYNEKTSEGFTNVLLPYLCVPILTKSSDAKKPDGYNIYLRNDNIFIGYLKENKIDLTDSMEILPAFLHGTIIDNRTNKTDYNEIVTTSPIEFVKDVTIIELRYLLAKKGTFRLA